MIFLKNFKKNFLQKIFCKIFFFQKKIFFNFFLKRIFKILKIVALKCKKVDFTEKLMGYRNHMRAFIHQQNHLEGFFGKGPPTTSLNPTLGYPPPHIRLSQDLTQLTKSISNECKPLKTFYMEQTANHPKFQVLYNFNIQ